VGERLGREDEQGRVTPVLDDGLDDRHLVTQRLPRCGARRDRDTRPGPEPVDRGRSGACRRSIPRAAMHPRLGRSARHCREPAARAARISDAPSRGADRGRLRCAERRTCPSGEGTRPTRPCGWPPAGLSWLPRRKVLRQLTPPYGRKRIIARLHAFCSSWGVLGDRRRRLA
jgi:hypothetical protein